MLLLGVKLGKSVHIGDDMTVTVISIDKNQVKLGFDAPKDVNILREEVKARNESQETS